MRDQRRLTLSAVVSQLAAVFRVTQKLNSWFGWSVGQNSSERKSFRAGLPRGRARYRSTHLARRSRSEKSAKPWPSGGRLSRGRRALKGLCPYMSMRGGRPFGSRRFVIQLNEETSPVVNEFPPITRLRRLRLLSAP